MKFNNVPMQQFLTAASAAVAANVPDTTVLKILGVSYTKAQLLEKLAEMGKPYKVANDARTTYLELVATRDAAEPAVVAFADAYAAAIKNEFNTSPSIDQTFGVPRASGPRGQTLEEKLAAKAKRQETRKLRNTMGSRQKEGIKAKGDVTVTATLGGTAAPAPQPTPAPVATLPQPPSPQVVNGASNGAAAPMLMNGAGH
jgi:hypothetical protein